MIKQHRKFVLHSGGLDSSTALFLATDQLQILRIVAPDQATAYSDYKVISVSVNYGQRHVRELEFAKQMCYYLGIDSISVDMAQPPKSMLTDADSEVPDASYSDLPHGISPTYVPFRNGQLLSRIAGIAQGWVMEADNNAGEDRTAEVWFGAHAEDAQNWAYPDCTPEFIGAMANAIYVGTYHKVRLITPFQFWTKAEIVQAGAEFGVPYRLTWSCYKGEELHCGICPTCRARKEAFQRAGIKDPTVYVSDATAIDRDPLA